MTRRSLVFLLAAFAASPSPAARVELVPDAVAPAAPGAAASYAAPVPLGLFPSPLAASSPLAAAPAALTPPALSAEALPALAAAKPEASPEASRSTLLQTLSAPLPDVSKLSGAGSAAEAENDFAARAQLGGRASAESSTAIQPAARPAAAAQGRTSADARQMESTLIPAWIKEELPVAAAKLGRELPPAYAADVLARSKVWVYSWHSRWTYAVSGGLPDGHFDPKFGIRLMLKTGWRGLKDPMTHFRVLFAHEYTHWLQEEGRVTRRYGVEIPAVAVEQLRAFELVGWEGMMEGRVGFIAEGNLRNFEQGREWARGDMKDESQLYFRGTLGGAAYEVGRIAGRPEAAWEFLNLVIAEKGGLKPREAFERVAGRSK